MEIQIPKKERIMSRTNRKNLVKLNSVFDMKKVKFYIILFTLSNCAQGQEINFNSYKKITDTRFLSFLSKFDEKKLPISTDLILSEINFRGLKKTPLNKIEVDEFLTDKKKELITGPLYKEIQEAGLPIKVVTGEFIPLYKLPTNGDYVLLVFAQVELETNKDCVGLIFTLSYDLHGEYIYFSNYTYRPGTETINSVIDDSLKSHLFYVINEINGKIVAPPLQGTFKAMEGHLIYQINPNGKSSRVSFDKVNGEFSFSRDECRFKKMSN